MLRVLLLSICIAVATISPTNPMIYAGDIFFLRCSAYIASPPDSLMPEFNWFVGQNNASLPAGVIVLLTTSDGNVHSSTLQFSPLQESHAGAYTCQIRNNPSFTGSTILRVYPGEQM